MPTENNEIITTTLSSPLQSFSMTTLPLSEQVALLNERTLVWPIAFHALWPLENCIPLSLGLIS